MKTTMHKKTLLHLFIWIAASLVGVAAVLYAKLIARAQAFYFQFFYEHPTILTLTSPILFVAAAAMVRYFSIEARGSGIPQVLEAIELARHPDHQHQIWVHRLVSLKTALIKILSSTLGILAGASIGREGPTVQIAASGFSWVGSHVRKFYPQIDFQSFVTAGAAAGVAAAFNTPLAGITFALEEVLEGTFGPFKQLAVLGVVISGITAQAMGGNYLYFGHPNIDLPGLGILILETLPIAVIAGLLGGIFAMTLSQPEKLRLPRSWWMRALICGVICSLVGWITQGQTAGSGYEVTRKSLEALTDENPGLYFPLWKFATTVLSYLSGMAGGIFAPSLSIGAGIGLSVAKIAGFTTPKACALIGMVGFFAGVVQAPLTAVVIVMEMTDQHTLILPFMVSAFVAQGIGKWLMPIPLYRFLATRHRIG
jgi:H+/Cl- antiporter ClcA